MFTHSIEFDACASVRGRWRGRNSEREKIAHVRAQTALRLQKIEPTAFLRHRHQHCDRTSAIGNFYPLSLLDKSEMLACVLTKFTDTDALHVLQVAFGGPSVKR